jgi:hypothetical protein
MEVNAFVARFVFPDNVPAIFAMVEANQVADFQALLEGLDVVWSMPKACLSGDVVFFQLGLRSPQNLRKARLEALRSREGEMANYLDLLEPMVQAYAGSLVAAGRVSGHPTHEDPGPHFGGRIYAPITDVTPLDAPVLVTGGSPLTRFPEYRSHGPVTHRMFSSNEAYQATLGAIRTAGNDLPAFLAQTHVGPPLGDDGTWLSRVRRSRAGWFSEAHLCAGFAEPLCRLLADQGRFKREVPVRTAAGASGVVDYSIEVGGVTVPVEVKLNHTAERDFLSQVRRYTGPGQVGSSFVEHGIVLAIDARGIYVLENGAWTTDAAGEPKLRREDITLDGLAALRSHLSRLVRP